MYLPLSVRDSQRRQAYASQHCSESAAVASDRLW